MAAVYLHCGLAVEQTLVISRLGMVGVNLALRLWVTQPLTRRVYVCHVHKSSETLNAGVAKRNNTVRAKYKAVTGEEFLSVNIHSAVCYLLLLLVPDSVAASLAFSCSLLLLCKCLYYSLKSK